MVSRSGRPASDKGAVDRVTAPLSRMTLAEKVGLLFHPSISLPGSRQSPDEALESAASDIADRKISHFHVVDGDQPEEIAAWISRLQSIARDTRLGIPLTFSSDPRNGFGRSPFTGKAIARLSRWPEALGIAATRDPAVARDFGDTVRQEFAAMGIRTFLGPMADIFSEPRWSRGYGTFGEDAELVSEMVVAFIEGLHRGSTLGSDGVAAVVKHFPGGGPQKDGHDAHDRRFPEQVYPGGLQELHLKPFEAALEGGVTQVMPYYGMPVGTDWPELGFAYNAPVIEGLLRGRFGFDGMVVSDWHIVLPTDVDGIAFGPNAYGVEGLDPAERFRLLLESGIDQFGGERATDEVLGLVESGVVSEARIDQSARRILVEKDRLGLLDEEPETARAAKPVFNRAELLERGMEAQRRSLALLKNGEVDGEPLLPIGPALRLFAERIDWESVTHDATVVDDPAEADLSIIRMSAPWTPDGDSALGDLFRGGSLEYPKDVVDNVARLAALGPVLLAVSLERPAVLTDVLPLAAAIVAEYGCGDQVLFDAFRGAVPITGRLPFDLPSSDAAVAASAEDVPFDTAEPLFHIGEGQRLDQTT